MRLSLALLAAVAACGGSAPADAPPAADPAPAAVGLDSAETAALARSGGAAWRTGAVLLLAVGQDTVRFADDSTEGDDYRNYRYAGPVAGSSWHLVQIQYFEGRAYQAVHGRTGWQRLLEGPLLLSPDGRYGATWSFDLVAGFDANGIEIFRVEADTLALDWRIEPGAWGPDSVRWRGVDTLGLVQRWADSVPDVYRNQRATVTRRGAGWYLDPVDPPPPGT